MATRPWAITAEVKEYSDLPAVQNRTDAKVATDITRAEQYIIAYTNNDFSDSKYPTIPAAVKTAAAFNFPEIIFLRGNTELRAPPEADFPFSCEGS